MSMHERYGRRDLTYSSWHRTLHPSLHWIDIDAVEYCAVCKEPLVVIETAQDVGQAFKPTTVLRNVARRMGVPGYLVFYKANDGTVERLRVRKVWPQYEPVAVMTPEDYEAWLLAIREHHRPLCGLTGVVF